MLTIRDSQKAALVDAFTMAWLGEQINRLFPQECLAMGTAAISRLILASAARAKKLGFTRDDYLQYLAMEICFGEGFVEASEGEWARKALDTNRAGRMQSLYRAAVFRLAKLAEAERRRAGASPEVTPA